MAEDKKENKIMLEREYIVPLRAGWLKAQKYKRANRAVKELKMFLVQHMKVYDRDLDKIKVDILLNNEIRFKGIKKPLHKIKVKAIKYEDGNVVVKLAEMPKHLEFELAKKVKRQAELLKLQSDTKTPEIKQPEAKENKEENKEKAQETKEKETSSKDAELKLEKTRAKEAKHTSKTSQQEPKIQRKALQK